MAFQRDISKMHHGGSTNYATIQSVKQFQELAAPETGGRNWKGILIALCVIAVICAIVIMAVAFLAPSKFWNPTSLHLRSLIRLAVPPRSLCRYSGGSPLSRWAAADSLRYHRRKSQSIIQGSAVVIR